MRYQEGKSPQLPVRVLYQLVAARYGQTPMSVEEWPADKFLDAVSMLGATRVVL